MKKYLIVFILTIVTLLAFAIPSFADTSIEQDTFPIVNKGVYYLKKGDDNYKPFAQLFPYVDFGSSSIESGTIKLDITTSDGLSVSLTPISVSYEYGPMPDGTLQDGHRFAFTDVNGDYFEVYTFDVVNRNNPQTVIDANWYCAVGLHGASSVWKEVSIVKFNTYTAITDLFITNIFAILSDYDYIFDTIVTLGDVQRFPGLYLNGEYDIDIYYRNSTFRGPWFLEFPVYTSSGGLRILATKFDEDGNQFDRIWLDSSYEIRFGLKNMSLKASPELYGALVKWNSTFGSEPSYFVNGKMYAKREFTPYFIYANIPFTSNGEYFTSISSGTHEYSDNEFEYYIRYDNKQVYTQRVLDNVVIQQGWSDINYKLIDFGSANITILKTLYDFLNLNYTSSDSSTALDDAFNDGYELGLEQGKDAGIEEGIEIGYEQGYNTGFDKGYNTGYNTGYNEGFNNGVALGGGGDVSSSLGSFFESIINALDNFFILDGISIYDILNFILGAVLCLFVLRLIAGG